MPGAEQNLCCALCQRQTPALTRHHLIPRSLHQRSWVRRSFTREERHETCWLCRPCHKQVHAILSEAQIAREFRSLDALAAQPQIAIFLEWIRRQPAGTDVRVRKSRDARH